ncbi:MAG TPA: serine/threonine-protein kinase [Polyangiaceae bacterium]|nr:serine/threonine-protein kinase [Polyangiaceae bacterium]
MSEAPFDEQLGLRLGDVLADRYRLGQVLARGGMGFVVAAEHLELGTAVAIKVLKAKFARDETYLTRFRREALAAATLRSEHIVRVIDFGRVPSTGAPYLVMEHLEGEDLASALASARARGEMLPVRDVCAYVTQACQGLAVAHAAGIIHRDLKPANLFLTWLADGSPCVKVLDFGISKQGAAEDLALTSPREVLGSPLYMSPEQLRAPREVDARSDVWSLGVILFELLAGQLPFDDPEFGELFMRIQTKAPPELIDLRPEVPPALSDLVARCLQKSPDARPADVGSLVSELGLFASPDFEHHVTATQRMSLRTSLTRALPDASDRGPRPANGVMSWPAEPSEEARARALRPMGPRAIARRLFGTKTLAPLAGDSVVESAPRWPSDRRTKRVVVGAGLMGVVLGGASWFALRPSAPAPHRAPALAAPLPSAVPKGANDARSATTGGPGAASAAGGAPEAPAAGGPSEAPALVTGAGAGRAPGASVAPGAPGDAAAPEAAEAAPASSAAAKKGGKRKVARPSIY